MHSDENKDFWVSLYDKFLDQLDKRIDYLNQQIHLNSKKKDLRNIYGQTFTGINFGNASYAPLVPQNDYPSPLTTKRKKKVINAELL